MYVLLSVVGRVVYSRNLIQKQLSKTRILKRDRANAA